VRLGETAALSHPGRKRRHNEDSYVVQPPLFAVADGMGGAKAGEVASGLAAAAVQEIENEESGEARVAALIEEANRRVFTRASEDRDASGMGTTMTVALIEDDHVAIGHVGDSRAYLIRDGRLEQLTDDHSLVAELVRSGKLTPEEAESHPQRSVITRALGTEADVDVDTFSVEAAAGDLFLLCSDGLTTMVDDQTILDAVERHRPNLEAAAKALINAANRGGGEDNITVVFFEVAGAEHERSDETEDTVVTSALPDDEETLDEADEHPTIEVLEEKRRGRLLPILAALAALLIIAAAVLWLLANS
jgi:serine/threonine protein phosphatase PrpC